jgi:hypothetical protein
VYNPITITPRKANNAITRPAGKGQGPRQPGWTPLEFEQRLSGKGVPDGPDIPLKFERQQHLERVLAAVTLEGLASSRHLGQRRLFQVPITPRRRWLLQRPVDLAQAAPQPQVGAGVQQAVEPVARLAQVAGGDLGRYLVQSFVDGHPVRFSPCGGP